MMKIPNMLMLSAAFAGLLAQAPVAAQEYYARHKLNVTPTTSAPETPAEWEAGAWGAWSSTCSDAAVRTRAVLCKKGADVVVDTECAAVGRPSTSEVQSVTTSCSYEWAGRTGSWSQSCGYGSTRTTSFVCERSDDSVVSDGQCGTAKPTPVVETRTSYDGCKSKEWALGEPRDLDYCAQGMIRTIRSLSCIVDGEPVDNSQCSGMSYPNPNGTAACSSPNHCVSGTQTRRRISSPEKILIGSATVGTRYTSPMYIIYDFCNRYAGGKLRKCSGESVQVGAMTTVTVYGVPATAPEPVLETSSSFSDYVFNCTP